MKRKVILTILSILFIITYSGAATGFYYSKNRVLVPQKPIETKQGKVTYVYYLEDEKVDKMPVNVEIDEEGNEIETDNYLFSRFVCTNDLSGKFDTNKWQFIPSEEKDSTCNLYFVNSKYSVTLTIINGVEDESNEEYVEREKNGVFKITPDDGYAYKDAICSDDKEVFWDDDNKSLLINAVTKDVMCKVNFTIKTLSAKFNVVNGTGNTTSEVKYGESVEAVIEANDGYEKPLVECTNNQEATYENGKVLITKLTDNTECKITFNAVPIKMYELNVELPSEVIVISGSTSQEIESGKDGTFTLQTDDGYLSNLSCGDITPSKVEDINSSTKKYTFLSVTNNISCKVTAVKDETISGE